MSSVLPDVEECILDVCGCDVLCNDALLDNYASEICDILYTADDYEIKKICRKNLSQLTKTGYST